MVTAVPSQLDTIQKVSVPTAKEAYWLSVSVWMGKENFAATGI